MSKKLKTSVVIIPIKEDPRQVTLGILVEYHGKRCLLSSLEKV